MRAASWPRADRTSERLLLVDVPGGRLQARAVSDLATLLDPGDVLVVNDAATLPASLGARTASGQRVELRLARHDAGGTFWAAVLGDGDWRTPTEHRPRPAALEAGAALHVGADLVAQVLERSSLSPNLVRLRFDASGARLWQAIYRHGRVVQYSHVTGDLELWHVQTPYAARPWAFEMPAAGRPLAWSLLVDLARRGVRLTAVTHAAGLSATGDPAVDAALPLPERYDVPVATVESIDAARAAGRRVIAVGTSVVRALEGCASAHGRLVATEGETDVVLGRGTPRLVVDALLTGIHEPGSSHASLIRAFAPDEVLSLAHALAEAEGYLGHEFGDKCLVVAPLDAARALRAA